MLANWINSSGCQCAHRGCAGIGRQLHPLKTSKRIELVCDALAVITLGRQSVVLMGVFGAPSTPFREGAGFAHKNASSHKMRREQKQKMKKGWRKEGKQGPQGQWCVLVMMTRLLESWDSSRLQLAEIHVDIQCDRRTDRLRLMDCLIEMLRCI